MLVHGAMDRAASFGRVMRRLGHLDVIAYDRRGYAGSLHAAPDPFPEDVLAMHAADLARVAGWAAQAGGAPPVTIGHSLGGLLALLAAEPGGIPTVGAFEAPLPWFESDGRTSGSATLEVGAQRGPGAAAEFFYRAMVGDRTWERLPERTREQRLAEGPTLLAELADARRPHGGDGDAPVPVPAGARVAVACGETGPEHLRAAARRLAEAAGTTVRTLPGAGHGAHLSHPDLFADWVAEVALGTPAPT